MSNPATPPTAPTPEDSTPTPAPEVQQAAPVAMPERDDRGRFLPVGLPDSVATRPTVSAMDALKLDRSPGEDINAEIDRVQNKVRDRVKVTDLPSTPEPEPEPEPEPVAATTPEPEPSTPEPEPEPAASTPEKIKVGDREYSPEELQEALAAAQASREPAPEPQAATAAAEPEVAPGHSAEEVEALRARFLADTAAAIDLDISEEMVDTIAGGGEEAVSALKTLMQSSASQAVIRALDTFQEQFQPDVASMRQEIAPLTEQYREVQRFRLEQEAVAAYPEYSAGRPREVSTQVAQELVAQYPREVSAMSRRQFIDEVARQSDVRMTREHQAWFKGDGNWRASLAAEGNLPDPTPPVAPAPVAPAPVAPAPVAPAPVAPAPVAPAGPHTLGSLPPHHPLAGAVQTAPRPRPPAATAPMAAATGGMAPDWNKSVAATLR